MQTELTVLALAGLLQAVQFVLMAVPANRTLGTRYTAGPRDAPAELPGTAGRLKRALDNHFEGLIMFTLAVVVVVMGERSGAVTVACAWVYLVARVLYVPAYAFGWTPWRSVLWGVGFLATMVMIAAALLAPAAT